MTTGKTIALTRWIFVSKVMSLLFNMQSRFVIGFLPRSRRLLISWLQSPSTVILRGSKITMKGYCSHEIKGHLLLGRKTMTNLDSIFKSRDITLPTKVCLVKAMVFSVVMYGCELDWEEGWAPKNWCFWTVVLEKTLESPLDYKEIQPVNPKGNNPEYSLEGLMLKLKLQYFGHLMGGADSLENTLLLGKIEGRRRRGQQRVRWLDGITDSMDMS